MEGALLFLEVASLSMAGVRLNLEGVFLFCGERTADVGCGCAADGGYATVYGGCASGYRDRIHICNVAISTANQMQEITISGRVTLESWVPICDFDGNLGSRS
eukprot:3205322-Rhodomonas_salina.2